MRIANYQREVIDLSTAMSQSLPTNYSLLIATQAATCFTCYPITLTVRQPSPRSPRTLRKARLPFLARLPFRYQAVRLAYLPLHAPSAATFPLPARHQPAHLAYRLPNNAAVATAETSLHSTRISYTPQLPKRPVARLASRSKSRSTKPCA